MAYITAAELKRYLGITSSTDDTLLGELIASAQKMIETEIGLVFEAASDTTRYFHAIQNVSGRSLLFDRWCASITSITNGDGASIASTDYVTLETNDAPFCGVKLLGSKGKTWTYTTDPENAISVTGKWAYMTTPDDEVKQATRDVAMMLYRRRENANDVDRAVIVGNATIAPTQWPPSMLRLISKYRPHTGWS